MAEPTDEELARRAQDGETQWFALLVARYEPKLTRYAEKFLFGREDREDLVQEVFVKAFVNLREFDTKRRFSSWVYRIAHNEFLNALRKRERQPLSFIDPDTLLPRDGDSEEEARRAELTPLLEKSLVHIEAKYREPLILFYYEGLSYKEIAEVLRIPVSTVGVRIKRGREVLKKLMTATND